MLSAPGNRRLNVDRRVSAKVHYARQVVGHFYADLIGVNRGVVELKACRALNENDQAELLNVETTEGH